MKPAIVLVCGLLIAALHAQSADDKEIPQSRKGIANCEVTRPSGDYALAILELTVPGDPKNQDRSKRKARTWTYVGGVRGGRMRVDDGVGLRTPGGRLEVKEGKLSGSFHRVDLAAEVRIDATIDGSSISGSAMIGDEKATVSGRYLTESQLAKRNPIARDKSWPAAQGPPGAACSAPWTGAATIDDPAQLRMLWRCEESDIVFRVAINGGDFCVKNDGIGHGYFILYDGLGYI